MISYILNKIKKNKQKKTFKEYGYEIRDFEIESIGPVQYAQWLHPFEQPKDITISNIQFYQKLAKKGTMIIDIGAHTGDTTVPMALAVGKEGLVLGLEPNKYVYEVLEKNAALNPTSTNIKPLCFAATEQDGTFTFNYSDASFCNGGFLSQIESKNHKHDFELEVTGKNLQTFLFENYKDDLNRLDLIKVDAEGYDKEILKTIPDILTRYKPNLMLECYKKLNQEERNELFDLVSDLGYELYFLDDFELFDKLDRIEKGNMMDQKHFEILAIHKSKRLEA